jgi:polyphosphate kinase 2 (PPK2 family)
VRHDIVLVKYWLAHLDVRRAAWTRVEANHKYYARIKVLRTLCEALEKAL